MELATPTDDSLARVAAALELVAVPVVTVAPDLTVHSVNRAFLERYGHAADRIRGRTIDALLDRAEQRPRLTLDALGGAGSDRAEFTRHVVGPAGTTLAVRVSAEAVREHGATIGYVVTLLDAEPLDHATSASDLLAHRWRTVLDELPIAVTLNVGGRLRYANPAAVRLNGCETVAQVAARVASREHVHPSERERLAARMAELMTGGPQTSAQPRRWTIVRPDGTERKVEAYTLLVAFDGTPAVLVAFVDITEQVEAESVIAASERRQREVIDALQRSEARLHSLVAQSPVGIFETDPEGGCVYVNDRWSELTGSTFEASLGWGWADAVHPDDRVRLLTGFRAALAGASPFATELRYRRSSGEVVHVHLEARPLYGDAGTLTGWLGTATDLTAQVALRTELAESEARFRELADGSPDVVVRMRIDPVSFDYVGPAIASLTGCPAETYVREPELLESQIHPDDIERVTAVATDPDAVGHVEFRLLHRDGTYHVVEARLHRRIVDDVVVGLHATLRDVTAAADLREHLRDLSRRDPLTGLLNRRALVDALHERVARHEPTALLFIDLDDFKSVNDTLGHDAGDDVLTAIAGRLSGGLRAGTLVSRFAGDEFVVVLDPAVAEDVAVRLREQAARPIVLRGGASATVGMSIGVAELDPNVSQPVADLLHRADDAMYRAKRRARDAR